MQCNFTEGGDIEAGVSLYQIDPATYGPLIKAQSEIWHKAKPQQISLN